MIALYHPPFSAGIYFCLWKHGKKKEREEGNVAFCFAARLVLGDASDGRYQFVFYSSLFSCLLVWNALEKEEQHWVLSGPDLDGDRPLETKGPSIIPSCKAPEHFAVFLFFFCVVLLTEWKIIATYGYRQGCLC